jgi:hypothetical protein
MTNVFKMQKNFDREYERWEVAKAMVKFGGAFVESLGWAISRANFHDAKKIKIAFPELWEQYAALYKEDMNGRTTT